MTTVKLTTRESEIAELIAWGAAKKEVADHLCISERTVENHARSIYEKTRCNKVNELSAWWFCTHFGISFDLSPLKQRIISIFLLMLLMSQIADNGNILRVFKTKTVTTCRSTRTRRNENDCEFDYLT
jgi:DNA-binding CsgD family transcriptional regulator